VMVMPPAAAKPLMKTLRAEYAAFVAGEPDASLEAFFKFAAPHIYDCWYDEVATRQPPTLLTADGAPLTLSTLIFDVPKGGEALAALLMQPDFEPGEADCATWIEDAADGRRILGDVRCDRGTLTLTTFSRERANRGRARLVELLGPLAIRDEQHRDAGDLLHADHAQSAAADAAPIPLGDIPELAAWQAQKDCEWLDLEIPALDGATPREAARDRRLRSRLRELLLDIENREARITGAGHSRDFSWMWKELKLRRP
jgi:hypothetical protein